MAVGQRLGPYEVVGPLGVGGMGEVYRARDTKLGRDVAIKILPEAFAKHPDRLRRFEREARLLAALIGCVLFEMLTGRRAFAGATASDSIAAILERDPDWSALPTMTEGIRSLLSRCLQKDKARRLSCLIEQGFTKRQKPERRD